MSLTAAHRRPCATCGVPLDEDAPDGLCPKCLFSLGAEGIGPARPRLLEGYEILEEVGRGGAGVVFRALQLSLNRPVALKLLLNSRMLEASEVERFKAEAETIAQLRHPNIVRVHEVGDENGQPWFSMDLIDGPNLASALRESPLPFLRAAQIVRKVALAVEYAHERKVLHLDLKPSNVVLDGSGEPHVTDFGLAMRTGAGSAPGQKASGRGTPSYMAPEQVVPEERTLSPATDVWALGAMLYHLLCGRPPFVGGTVTETAAQVLNNEPISPRLLNPSVPKDLETISLKCLRKAPGARYESPRAVAEELERFETGVPVRARPVNPAVKAARWAQRQPALAALIGAFLIATAGWFVASDRARRSAVHAAALAQAAAQEKQQLLAHQYLERGFEALSSHAESAALPWLIAAWRTDAQAGSKKGNQEAHQLRVAAALNATPSLAGLWRFAGQGNCVDVSPSGELACGGADDGRVVVWSTATGKSVCSWEENVPVVRARFHPYASELYVAASSDPAGAAATAQTRISVRNPRTGELLREWAVTGRTRSLALSPDGLYCALATQSGRLEVRETRTGRLASPEALKHLEDARSVEFTPDSQQLVSCSFDGTTQLWNWQEGKPAFILKHGGFVRAARISPDGRKAASASDDGSAQVWSLRTGAPLGQPLRHLSRVYSVAFSPDGHWVATASSDSTARVWNAQTGEPLSPPLPHRHRVTHVTFSPDGQRLLTATSEGLIAVWHPTTGKIDYSVDQTGEIQDVAWLPSSDGFVSINGVGLATQWKLPAHDRWVRELTVPESPNFLRVSPTESKMLAGFDGGLALLWDWRQDPAPIPLRHPHDVVGGGFFPSAPLAYTFVRQGPLNVLETQTGKTIWQLPAQSQIRSLNISPDGRTIALGEDDGSWSLWDLKAAAPRERGNFSGRTESLVFSRDGRRLAGLWFQIEANDPRKSTFQMRIWDASERKILCTSAPLNGQPNGASFSPDGKLLAVASSLGASYLLSADTGRVLFSFPQPGEVYSVDFGHDGKVLLTAGSRGVVRLWNTETGQLVTSEMSQKGGARARFSKDSRWILTWGRDLRAQLWDSATFAPLLPPHYHDDAIIEARLTADRKLVLTLGLDNKVRFWPIPSADLTLKEAERRARLISGHEIDSTGAVTAVAPAELEALWVEESKTRVED